MPGLHVIIFFPLLAFPFFFFFFTLTSTSNYFRGKKEARKSKDLVQNTALSSSSWGELVSCEIISVKWMPGCMHSPDNGWGQKGSRLHTGGWQRAVGEGLKPAASSGAPSAFPEKTQSSVGQGGNSHRVPIKTDQVTHVDIPIS